MRVTDIPMGSFRNPAGFSVKFVNHFTGCPLSYGQFYLHLTLPTWLAPPQNIHLNIDKSREGVKQVVLFAVFVELI